MASNFIFLPPADGGGGGGAVSDVNGGTGSISILAGTGIDVTTFGPNITITNTSPAPSGTANTVAGYDGGGLLISLPGFNVDTISSGLSISLVEEPNNQSGDFQVNRNTVNLEPLQNSPNESWTMLSSTFNLDTANSGFTLGTAGRAVQLFNNNISNVGTSDIGEVVFTNNYFNLGNGTDPIDVRGFSYCYGFGNVNAGVNISGPMQGYGFQPSINASATVSPAVSITAFYDAANMPVALPSYNSVNLSPTIGSINNNNNYTGINLNTNITTFTGNSGYTGIGVFPNLGTINSGSFTGVNVAPNVTLNNGNAVGLQVSMNNVTNYAGAQASLVVQDITYTMNEFGTNGNSITVEYTNTVLAGNEVATFSNPNIVVSIESGVSTATQVLAAIAANFTITSNAVVTITGTASNPQVTYAQTNLAGGINPGTSKAAQFDGDVSINGGLSFTGGLSIGAFSSFASLDLATLPSGVNSIDTLITQPTVAANATVSGIDLIAVNTAMLMSIGDNATVTSTFLGYSALGLPAVVSMGTGATIDLVNGATFAISLDAAATGGAIDGVNMCRALAIPNGVTTVTKLKGYAFDLPFGDPGTTTWGLHVSPTVHNYMAGDLMVGGTAGSDDTPANASVGIELKSTVKAFLPSRMTTTERDALTAVDGMVLYNTTTDKLQVRAAGSWVDLH